MSTIIHKGKEACPKCGHSSGYTVYDDHAYCFHFGCGYYHKCDTKLDNVIPRTRDEIKQDFQVGTPSPIKERGLHLETCEKYGYWIHRKGHHIANYYAPDGELVAQKLRKLPKTFVTIGKAGPLLGQHLFKPKRDGKYVTITEGEIDCLSIAQVFGCKYPVVSLPLGAQSAEKSIRANLEWLDGFDEVRLCFDNDESGQGAMEAAAKLLAPGKVKIVQLPADCKDANETLLKHGPKKLIEAVNYAKPYCPTGITRVTDVLEQALKPVEMGLPWFLPSLSKATYGRHPGQVWTLGGGSGCGKSDFLAEQIAFDITELGLKVGTVFLEQPPHETLKRLASKISSVKYHVPGTEYSPEQLRNDIARFTDSLTLYDGFGGADWDDVKAKIRYMVLTEGCSVIYLDHLTGLADTSKERESLEQLMKEAATLANDLQFVLVMVSHLTTPEKGSHEEGARVMARHFKGSRAIVFWSHMMLGLERNTQADNDIERCRTRIRVLKDRFTGAANGHITHTLYDMDTGRLHETDPPPSFSDSNNQSINTSTGEDYGIY